MAGKRDTQSKEKTTPAPAKDATATAVAAPAVIEAAAAPATSAPPGQAPESLAAAGAPVVIEPGSAAPAAPGKADPAAVDATAAPVAALSESDPDPILILGEAAAPAFMRAVSDVALERLRQVEAEGFSPESDDAYTAGELPRAAICYALEPADLPRHRAMFSWPFGLNSWKPGQPRRDLVKAAALLIAEIERIDRLAEAAPGA